MGVSLTTVEALRSAKHDAVHLRDEGLIRLPDPKITAKAVAESRIVLTFDLDFGATLLQAAWQRLAVLFLNDATLYQRPCRLFQVLTLSSGRKNLTAREFPWVQLSFPHLFNDIQRHTPSLRTTLCHAEISGP
jgi:hypothetical protein